MPLVLIADALFLDGQSAQGNAVRLELNGSTLTIHSRLDHALPPQSRTLEASQWNLETTYKDGFFRIQILDLEPGFCEGHSPEFAVALSASPVVRTHFALRILIWSSAFILAIVFMYFFVLPKAVSLATLQISRSVDMALGTKVMSSLPWKTKTPPEKARRIFELSQTFLDTLGARRGLRFRLHWMADTTFANAFALPGGDVLLFPRILDRMDSSSELLAVLAHEAGHEVQRHGMQNMLRAGLLGIVSSLSLGDVSGIGAVLADNAGSLLALSYNRREEAEADAFAIKALAELGQDCQGMELFFGKKPTEKSNYLPKFLSTHPSDSDRVKAVQKMRLKNSGCAISSQAWISSEAWARFKVKDSFENPAKDK